MLKYFNVMVVFEEVPDEVSLAINITNCPCKCEGCHSQYLWKDIGTKLTTKELGRLIDMNDGITCVCLMGGDSDHAYVCELAKYIKEAHSDLKVCWYSGMDELDCGTENFDYIKLGHYDENFGPLNNERTNQKFYRVDEEGKLVDETSKFWKKKKDNVTEA